ncbi:MAG TPA: 16S rRNA (cytidine(1402)-2'-O)-methyltransferase [Rhodospirillaceae bacterium]|nr:16S rRNA (cytidine(1402)-2'-O)-methyltransferase [Rhodospirillaceae bacterium]
MAGLPPCGLYVVATPIGNLEDMSARAINTLKAAAVIACEDTRVTGALLRHYGISTPMTQYHDHNALRARPRILKRLSAGESVALVCDAGTPLLSDPGYRLVRACSEAGISVFAVPGPSALLAALAVSGLPTDRVLYAGFLPTKSKGRRTIINEISGVRATLVFYESAQRLAATLADLSDVLGARNAAVCRELTKLHEEVQRGALATLATHYEASGAPKGEVVIVISPPEHTAKSVTNEELDAALRDALSTFSLRDAVEAVAGSLSQPRRVVYARAIALKKNTQKT